MAFALNVQEMVRINPFHVPEKFLVSRKEEDEPKSTVDTFDLSSKIPIIVLSLLSRGHNEELNKLDQACQEWGFFQVVNRGVATEELQGMKDASVKFFELPAEEKNKIRLLAGGFEGYRQVNIVSQGQATDLTWSDGLILRTYPTNLLNVKFWPNAPNGFNFKYASKL